MPSELFVSRRGGRIWAALREDGHTVEVRVEPPDDRPGLGRILRLRVSRVLPGIQSAFLDLGTDRDAFLHGGDLLLPGERPDPGAVSADPWDEPKPVGDRSGPPAPLPPIEQRLKVGRQLVVQVTRETLGTKGPRVSCYLSLAGRLLVLFPGLRLAGVSRRISDDTERERLREIIESVAPSGGGFVARTAARGADPAGLEVEARRLIEQWDRIDTIARSSSAPAIVHREPSFLEALMRDLPDDGLERVVFDDPAERQRALEFLEPVDPGAAAKLDLHAGPGRLFEALGLDREIDRALRKRVWLPSGGYVVIEETEALVSIDVNTGKFVGGPRVGETVLQTNLEAAREIARQLRLRDLGGIVVVDFIDMPHTDDRNRVTAELRQAMRPDRARTQILGLGDLGLLHLTRKRSRPGLASLLTRDCPLCAGHGRVKSPETLAGEALAEAEQMARVAGRRRFRVRAHPDVAAVLLARVTGRPAGEHEIDVAVEADADLRPNRWEVLPG